MKRHAPAGSEAQPVTTALGSLLAGAGLLCSDFPHRGEYLTTVRTLVPDWLLFFAECGFPTAPVTQLGEALDMMAADGAVLASALATYHTLFNSPDPPVPLWESLWLSKEKIFFTECTTQVRTWYRTYGFVIPSREAEDFLGYEMAFAGGLFDRAHSEAGCNKQADLGPFQQFLTEHLLVWGPTCVHELEQATDNSFWRALFASCHTVLTGLCNQDL